MQKLLTTFVLCASLGAASAGPDFETPMPRGTAISASPGTADLLPSDDVVFAHDSGVLSESARVQLDRAARWLRKHPRVQLAVDGYADALGSDVYNEDLAARRAHAVRDHLVRRGVASDRIVIAVYGERFASTTSNPLDRRVVLTAMRVPVEQIVKLALDNRQALVAMWTYRNATFLETRGMQTPNVKAIATR
jgi:outer membrane protein OmpA-like peptidoglycan-associated protein